MKQVWITCPACDVRSLVTPEKIVRGQSKKRRPSQSIKAKDEVWSRAIKERDKECMRCHRTTDLQAAHIFSRSKRATRWDLLNGITLCGGCHLFWAHRDIYEFLNFARNLLGPQAFNQLHQRSQTSVKKVSA